MALWTGKSGAGLSVSLISAGRMGSKESLIPQAGRRFVTCAELNGTTQGQRVACSLAAIAEFDH